MMLKIQRVGLGQAQKCGLVKLVNVITYTSLVLYLFIYPPAIALRDKVIAAIPPSVILSNLSKHGWI
jgi:hypothetical protein